MVVVVVVVKEREGVATEAGRENTCSQVWCSEHCYGSGCTLEVCSGLDVKTGMSM